MRDLHTEERDARECGHSEMFCVMRDGEKKKKRALSPPKKEGTLLSLKVLR